MRVLPFTLMMLVLAPVASAQDRPAVNPQPVTKPAATRPGEVYASDFTTGKAGDQWSNPLVEKSPSGKRTLLGPFATESTILTLNNLSDHARVRLSFDLLIIRTWDGDAYIDNPTEIGPDSLNVTVEHGPRLLNASFVNLPSIANVTQSFPGMFPYDHVNGGTSSIEHGTLGYVGISNDDYTYHVTRTFTHSGKSLKIAFTGINLQDKSDESWGLDNVKVEVLPAIVPRPVAANVFDPLWVTLGGEDPAPAVAAIATLVDLGDLTVAEIRKRPESPAASQPDRDALIHKLLLQLDDDSFTLREQACAALKDLGPGIAPALAKIRKEQPLSAEVKSRLDTVLADLATKQTETPAERRTRRLVEVLELIGTDNARKTLADMAEHATGFAAYEAKAATLRLAGNAPLPTKLQLPPGLPPAHAPK